MESVSSRSSEISFVGRRNICDFRNVPNSLAITRTNTISNTLIEILQVDSHDNPILLSSGAVTELSLLRHKVTGFQKERPTNNQPEIGASSFSTIELDESKDTKTKVDGVKEIKKSPVDSRSVIIA